MRRLKIISKIATMECSNRRAQTKAKGISGT
jgi:hypothetical protein